MDVVREPIRDPRSPAKPESETRCRAAARRAGHTDDTSENPSQQRMQLTTAMILRDETTIATRIQARKKNRVLNTL